MADIKSALEALKNVENIGAIVADCQEMRDAFTVAVAEAFGDLAQAVLGRMNEREAQRVAPAFKGFLEGLQEAHEHYCGTQDSAYEAIAKELAHLASHIPGIEEAIDEVVHNKGMACVGVSKDGSSTLMTIEEVASMLTDEDLERMAEQLSPEVVEKFRRARKQ